MIPLFVELCAGTAALSLRLHKDGARPPVSRMGAKTGYADAILRVLGLHPGQRAERYFWCEPDPGVRLLLHAYRDSELAKAAAAIIRGWKDEDPRALWERLRAEGPPRLPDGEVDAGEVARWAFVVSRAVPQAWARGITDGDFIGSREETPDGSAGRAISRETLACNVSATGDLPATIAPDAREVDPREVARLCTIMRWAYANVPIGHNGKHYTIPANGPDAPLTFGANNFGDTETAANGLDRLPEVQALIHPDARTIDPPQLPPGTVVYSDPPYSGTTPYAHDLPRPEVVALAHRWASAGATVCISEAEPIPELVAEGWHAVRIDGERKGQKRTFSKQQAEWLTVNRSPAWVPPVQVSLFG